MTPCDKCRIAELEPCPFCGSANASEDGYLRGVGVDRKLAEFVSCDECGASGPREEYAADRTIIAEVEKGRARWNTRTPDPAAHEALQQEISDIHDAIGIVGVDAPMTCLEAARALREHRDVLEAEATALRAELEKAQYTARQYCGAHVGTPRDWCPVCEVVAAEREVARLRAALEACEQEFITSRHAAQGEHRLAGVVRDALARAGRKA